MGGGQSSIKPSQSYVERFATAADAAKQGETLNAITAILGPEMDDHDPINANVRVMQLKEWLTDDQLAALGIADASNSAMIVGYNTTDGFQLKTAEKADVLAVNQNEN